MLTNLDDLYLFVTLVDEGSFTLAAKKTAMPKSTLSRRLAQLEQKIGSELLVRTTRSQELTESGRLLYGAAKEHVEALSKIEEEVGSLIHQPQGQLNILLPLEFFNRIISVLITDFIALYPKIHISCQHYSDDIPKFDPHYDLCFVLHEQLLPTSNWISKTLLSFSQSIYAPQSVDTTVIKSAEDLTAHNCILAQPNQPWLFRDNDKVQAIYVKGQVTLSSPEMRQQAAEKGLGLCKLPDYVLQQGAHSMGELGNSQANTKGNNNENKQSQLQRICLDKQPVAQQLSVLYQSRKTPVKTRAFLDYFQSNIGKLL
ncbi:MAG: LysR family transcriptional regulator [Colwellia sp.]|nr:LysR family transcriptional regulator [Colwellia sp.]